MTTETPRPVEHGDDSSSPPARPAVRLAAAGTDHNGQPVVKKAAPAKKTGAAAKKASPAPIVRGKLPPASRLDSQDREDTRATHDDDLLRRYKAWDWHKVAVQLVRVAGGAGVFLVCVIAVLLLDPHATPQQAMMIAGSAVGVGSGGLWVSQFAQGRRRSAGQRDRPAE